MKHVVAIALALSLTVTPALPQEDDGDLSEGFDLFSEGTRMIMEGLLEEMRPMLEDAQPFFEDEVAPFFAGLLDMMDDLSSYEMPERLPNGDIIIRRSPDAPVPAPPVVGDNGEVEL